MAVMVAERLGCPPEQVVVASTGVTGVRMPMNAIEAGIPDAFARLSDGDDRATADAILTTDTFPKRACLELETPDGIVRIGAIAKGAGMIAPNMATMLAFITSDAHIEPAPLQGILTEVVQQTFNCITVDGDTSTNDMVILLANGASGTTLRGHSLERFQQGLHQVCEYLAKRIVRDGEGATRLFEVRVEGASSPQEARQVARTIAESLLVKTALHGGDPNWGRILAAAGRSGVPIELNHLRLTLQDVVVFENGQPLPFDEGALAQKLLGEEVLIRLELGQGEASAHFWSCDLTAEYVKINSAYRT
jgi:glutamate N-acetyltransferase/amino-acid N-acetyltransferase